MKKIKISKEEILKTALSLMAEKGVDAVSMREIAQKLSVTKPMIYYYFKNKEDLIKNVFSCKAKEIEEMNFEDNEKLEVEDVIYMVLEKHYKLHKNNPDAVKCIMKIMDAPKESPIRKYAMAMRDTNRRKIKEILEKMAGRGKIKSGNIEYIIHMISALLSHQIFESRIEKKNVTPEILKSLSRIAALGIKHFKAALVTAAVSLLAIPAFSQLTVEEAVKIADSKNVSVLNALENQKIYEQKIKEYWGSVYPNISLSASYTRNIEKQSIFFAGKKIDMGLDNAYAASLDLNQILWAGGKVGTGIEMAEIYADSARENLLSAKKTVKKIVKQTYYTVGLLKETVKIQKEVLDISKDHLSTIKEQYNKGLQSDLAVMRQEVEVSNNEPGLIKAENDYEQGLLALKNILAMDPDDKLDLAEAPFCSPADESDFAMLYARALNNRSDFKLASLNLKLAEKQLRLEKAGHWPTLSAFASRGFSGQSDSGFPDSSERSWSLTAGLRFSMPIFSGFSVVARVSQAEHNLEIARRNLEDLKRNIKINIKSALLDMNEARKRVASQKTSVATAKKALEAVELRFKNGLSSQLELNDTVLALNKAETLYLQSNHDLCYNSARLDWELGN